MDDTLSLSPHVDLPRKLYAKCLGLVGIVTKCGAQTEHSRCLGHFLPFLLGCEVIAMMQPAKTSVRHNSRSQARDGHRSPERSVFVESEVRAVFVVVADVF